MAYIDTNMETSTGKKVRVKVPSGLRGQDRGVYVNGKSVGYKLGQQNDKVYTKCGSEVSSSLKDFIKITFWLWVTKETFKKVSFIFEFF